MKFAEGGIPIFEKPNFSLRWALETEITSLVI
jgi:hypothetical protein